MSNKKTGSQVLDLKKIDSLIDRPLQVPKSFESNWYWYWDTSRISSFIWSWKMSFEKFTIYLLFIYYFLPVFSIPGLHLLIQFRAWYKLIGIHCGRERTQLFFVMLISFIDFVSIVCKKYCILLVNVNKISLSLYLLS